MNARSVLTEWAPEIRAVPHENTYGACPVCLGTCGGYPTCFKCGKLWTSHPEFAGACDLIVPCTVAVSPGRWYTAMLQYKLSGQWNAYAPALASALWAWLHEHWGDLANALGGTPTLVTVVPSRSDPMPTPLYRIAMSQPKLKGLLSPVVAYDSSAVEGEWKRKSLEPDAFNVSSDVAGERVLLLEDTWVTGSTPLSAAIAVRRAGAAALALVPIARMVYEDAMADAYRIAAFAPIDFSRFPR